MPKLKEANSRVGFQLSIPVGFYSIMTYSTPSVTLPVTRSRSAQVEPIDVNIITTKTYMVLNGQQYSITNIVLYTLCIIHRFMTKHRGVSRLQNTRVN